MILEAGESKAWHQGLLRAFFVHQYVAELIPEYDIIMSA